MVMTLVLTFLMGLLSIGLSAQLRVTPPQHSPKEVVEEFWKLETDGAGLTPEGWSKASSFFVRAEPTLPSDIVNVIDRTDKIEETARTKNWAEITVYTNALGQIDSALRFRRQPQHGPRGELILRGPDISFKVIITDKHWELNYDGSRGRELSGPKHG